MSEHEETLPELILHADQFCFRVEAMMKDVAETAESSELRAKLGQCRAQLASLQQVYDEDKLDFKRPAVRADFRHLITALLWVAFYARQAIDFKTFRMLVRIESFFTFMLIVPQK